MFPDPRFSHLREKLRDVLRQVASDHAGSMVFYKRRWDEDRGDDYADWGCSNWFLEAAPDGTVTRQMEAYDDGTVLQYHADHVEDIFGFLTDQPMNHAEYRPFTISREEFEAAWTANPPTNQR